MIPPFFVVVCDGNLICDLTNGFNGHGYDFLKHLSCIHVGHSEGNIRNSRYVLSVLPTTLIVFHFQKFNEDKKINCEL